MQFLCKCVLCSMREETFWRNYFYRVSLIRQSVQLTSLAKCSSSTALVECLSFIVVFYKLFCVKYFGFTQNPVSCSLQLSMANIL